MFRGINLRKAVNFLALDEPSEISNYQLEARNYAQTDEVQHVK
jgi:hypothetical protein